VLLDWLERELLSEVYDLQPNSTTTIKFPNLLLKKHIALRGVVKSVSTDGSLNVDHIPIISMPWHRKVNDERLLNLSFAAMNPSLSGTFWLKLNVENKMVWFKVVHKHEDDIKCIVSLQKKALFKKSLNAELMERGLASVLPFDQLLYRNKTYKELHKNLTSSQSKAKRRNCGVWYKPTKWDAFRHLIDNSMHSIKNLRNVLRF